MKRKPIILLLLFAVLCIMPITAAQAQTVDYDQISKYIQSHMEKYEIPGMACVLVEDGQVTFVEGFGVLESGKEVRIDANTNFRIASVSKSFTALAIMQLEEQRLLELTDPVVKYLPWFGSKDVENSNKITIENLLQHTSGIPTSAYGLELKDGTEDDLEAQIKELHKIRLTATPGVRFQYSNFNFWIQALLIEKLTGTKFADYMEKSVFHSLNMDRTGYYRQVADQGNLAMGHRHEKGQSRPFDYYHPAQSNAAGGLYTNANDMGKYIIALLQEGEYQGRTIVSPESIDRLFFTGLDSIPGNSYGWFAGYWEGNRVVHHPGDNPNYTADLYLFPDKEMGFALISNSQHLITHFLSDQMAYYLLGNKELEPIKTTPMEGNDQMVSWIGYGSFLLLVIAALWIIRVAVGIKRGTHVFSKKVPGTLRLILQVILVPLIGVVIALFGFQLPIQIIGSYHIAFLYQPDLVKNVIGLSTVIIFFTLLVGVMGFVCKTKSNTVDQSKII